MAPPYTDSNHGRVLLPKDPMHRVIGGSVQKQTSPIARSPDMSTSTHMQPRHVPALQTNSVQNATNSMLPPARQSSTSNSMQVHVVVHNPANNNEYVWRPSPVEVLSRSPYFLTWIRAFTSTEMPILHIQAPLDIYDIVQNWMCTNTVRTPEGATPGLPTMIKVVFLADTFQLHDLSVQIVDLLRMKLYRMSAKQWSLPRYSEIYQKTSAGNPLRRFVAEVYVKTEMGVSGGNKPRSPLVDLPAAMLVDVIQIHEETWNSCSQETFDERISKTVREMQAVVEKQYAEKEAERVKQYEERMAVINESMLTAQTWPVDTRRAVLPEDIRKSHEQHMNDVERKSTQRYDDLVETMRKCNAEHLEAIQVMERATKSKEARLKKEIEELRKFHQECLEAAQTRQVRFVKEIEVLRKFKQDSVAAAQATAAEDGKVNTDLRSKVKDRENVREALMREFDALEKERGKAPSNSDLAALQEQLSKLTVEREALKKANGDLNRAIAKLEEEAGKHFVELTELERVPATNEERARRQLNLLHKRIDENAKKYREDMERLQATFRAKEDVYRKQLARLKKANRALLDRLPAE